MCCDPAAHHHGGGELGEGLGRVVAAGQDLHAAADHADGIAELEGRGLQRQAVLGGEVLSVAGAALVCGQRYAPAAGGKRAGQGFGGKQVSARAAGGDDG
jgi:hypothetical protein